MLTRSYGKHIYDNHLEEMFSATSEIGINNRDLLSYSVPLETYLSKGDKWFWCLGCNACLKRKEMTKKHMTGDCKQKHQEAVQKLKQQYPRIQQQGTPVTTTSSGLSSREQKKLASFVEVMMMENYRLRMFLHLQRENLKWGKDEHKTALETLVYFKAQDLESLECLLDLEEPEEEVFASKDYIDQAIEAVKSRLNHHKIRQDLLLDARCYMRDHEEVKQEEPELEPEPEPEPEPTGRHPVLEHLYTNIYKNKNIDEASQKLFIEDALRKSHLSDPVLEAFCKQEIKAPPPSQPQPATLVGSKRRPKSEVTPASPADYKKPLQFPPNFTTQAEQPKLPTIISITRRPNS
jgi:hypothetical protein